MYSHVLMTFIHDPNEHAINTAVGPGYNGSNRFLSSLGFGVGRHGHGSNDHQPQWG